MRTIADRINDLYPIATSIQGQGVSQALLALAWKARENNDRKLMAQVLAEARNEVAEKAGGFFIDDLNPDSFGKKIGEALYKNIDTPERMKNYLGQYRRDLAIGPMKQAISFGAGQGLVKEVHREATGDSTCPWCLDRCGVWDPYDANAYGVWARHGTCDCNIYIKWAMEDTNGET